MSDNRNKRAEVEDFSDTAAILRDEAFQIEKVELSPRLRGVEFNRALNGLDRSALCLSGGGIRSATFALGVIQGLASQPRRGKAAASADVSLLGRFQFISSVSGGGYIGSWLSAWLHRENFASVHSQLVERPQGPSIEPAAIQNLRRDSNYLTPKIGLTSADTWTAATMVVRNMTLNWLLVISALATLLLFLKFALAGLSFLGAGSPMAHDYRHHMSLLALGTVALIVGQCYTLGNYAQDGNGRGQKKFVLFDLVPAILGATVFTTWAILPIGVQQWSPHWLNVMLVGPTIFLASGIMAFPHFRDPRDTDTDTDQDTPRHNPWLRLLRWFFSGFAWSGVILVGIHLLLEINYAPARLLALAVLGPPWFLMAQITAETIYVAATSTETRSDAQREWFARAAGWFVISGVAWTAITLLALLGSRLTDLLRSETYFLYHSLIGGSLAGTAALGLLATQPDRQDVVGGFARFKRLLQIGGGQIFLALVLVVTSALLDILVVGGSLLDALLGPVRSEGVTILDNETNFLFGLLFGSAVETVLRQDDLVVRLFIAMLAAGLVTAIVSRTVNINRFSLHDLYRNRLVRAYLGATHRGRDPSRFTGFDLKDNPLMKDLWPQMQAPNEEARHGRLFHVLNATLNIVSTRNRAWQQRKAMSFTVTPRFSGAADLCPRDTGGNFAGAYQKSERYGGKLGISLGTAMAVSGAAANPAMGYNSTPSITLLFALFNVRLGWWLANPGPQGRGLWDLAGPRQALVPWLLEAFGQTTAERVYVNLSDGGHFENLGLYEMVRRRCRTIVLSDAGQDEDFSFADLGNAVRKIGIDLGVKVSFPHLDQLKPRSVTGMGLARSPYYTVGRIRYAEADGGGEDGYILYIKPGYHGTGDAGVRAYANESPTFPHESTADQWFSESQFESYRSLGFQIVETIFSDIVLPPGASLYDIMRLLNEHIERLAEG
ncbi:hypothetical protein ACQKKX_07640 [Neorhizobium sp. NPDC001467]|uniref:hypothetical protein n=1 Tax=Neorhizobium sp. NPDC001467 TaxID=3390595 RepID=UPI003D0128D7